MGLFYKIGNVINAKLKVSNKCCNIHFDGHSKLNFCTLRVCLLNKPWLIVEKAEFCKYHF